MGSRLIQTALIGLLLMGKEGASFAQAALQRQSVKLEDICEGENPEGMSAADTSSCAEDAIFKKNWPAFFKWGPIAAGKGDWISASWVGGEFRSRHNFFYAYMWYDIAAKLHAADIQNRAASDNPSFRQDNSSELAIRDEMGKKLSVRQIKEAISQERNWLAPDLK